MGFLLYTATSVDFTKAGVALITAGGGFIEALTLLSFFLLVRLEQRQHRLTFIQNLKYKSKTPIVKLKITAKLKIKFIRLPDMYSWI
jgi:hypothetical protein